MTNTVLLNNIDHADLRVSTARGPKVGDAVNQVIVVPTEYQDVQRDFPILLRRDEGGEYQSVALFGFDSAENLFLSADRWTSRYVPAALARGPFMIGMQRQPDANNAEPMINIDLDHPAVGSSEGAALFLKHGGNSPYLEHVAGILRRLHVGIALAKPLFDALAKYDLIEPVKIQGELGETMKFEISGFSAVSSERLNALDAASLYNLNQQGHLYPAFLMVASLSNIGRLIEMKARKVAAQPNGNGS